MLIKRLIMAILAAALVAAAGPQTPGSAQIPPRPAMFYFLNGINGLDVGATLMQNPMDISIDGVGCVKAGLQFRAYSGAYQLPEGVYTLNFSPAAADPCTNPAAFSKAVSLVSGRNYVIISALRANGLPTVRSYRYNLSHTTNDNGMARFTLVHAAKIGTVNTYLVARRVRLPMVYRLLSPGSGSTFQSRAVGYNLTYKLRGSNQPLFQRVVLNTSKFHHYFIALVGSPENGFYTASFSVNTYPFNPVIIDPYRWP